MFDFDLDVGVNQEEFMTFIPGDSISEPCFSPIGYLGLSISYDVRFPELYRQLILKGA